MRIAIIGYTGAGKSTLAKKLGTMNHIPVLHLDAVHHLPGWKTRDRADSRAIIQRFLDSNQDWVIDGTYTRLLFDERMRLADAIIIYDMPRIICFFRALRRYVRNRGHVREDMAPGCPETFDMWLFSWLLWKGRTPKKRATFKAVRAQYPQKTIVISLRGAR